MITTSASPLPETEMLDNELIQKVEILSKGNHSEGKSIQMRTIV